MELNVFRWNYFASNIGELRIPAHNTKEKMAIVKDQSLAQ